MRKILIALTVFSISAFLVSCQSSIDKKDSIETADHKQINYAISDVTSIIEYTGDLKDGKPGGECSAKLITDGTEWNFEGVISEDKISGQVTEMPFLLNINDKEYDSLYTGEVSNSIPNGCGKFTSNDFTCEGNFTEGQLINASNYKVENLNVIVMFPDSTEKYDGKYTGTYSLDETIETGKFIYKHEEDYFSFDGDFGSGFIIQNGELESNIYVVHFKEVDRQGEYKGEIVNGVANGIGIFNAENDEGVHYCYSGEWKNGLYNGIGSLKYDDSDIILKGTFKDGEETFTPSEIFSSVGSSEPKYNLSESQIATIEKYYTILEEEHDFTTYDEFYNYHMNLTDTELSYQKYAKNPDKYKNNDNLMYLENYNVVQISEEEDFLGYDDPFFQLIVQDNDYTNVCMIYGTGYTEGLYNNEKVNIWGLPLAYSSYKSIDGTDIPCICMMCIALQYDP